MAKSIKHGFYNILHTLIDDQITKRARPFLEMGPGPDGRERSDIVVSEDHNLSLVNAFIKPSAIDALLAENELPVHVAMAHCRFAALSIPWKNLGSGNWGVVIEGVDIVLTPREPEQWSVDDVRAHKEALISAALTRLNARNQKKKESSKPKKSSLMNMLKRKLLQALQPTVHIKDVHIRFERFGASEGTPPLSLGMILTRVDIDTVISDDGHQETTISMPGRSGIYCRTDHGGTADEAQLRFFTSQDAIVRQMKIVFDEAAAWSDKEWFLGPFSLQPGDASVQVQQNHKDDPSQFDYEVPLVVGRFSMRPCGMQATNQQLAALLSMKALHEHYKLWSSYAVHRPPDSLGRVARGASARAYWRAAKDGVVGALTKGHVTVSNLATILTDAGLYKKRYAQFLRENQPEGSAKKPKADQLLTAAEARRARARADPASIALLQELEDELPAETLAWCRLVAGTLVQSSGGGTRQIRPAGGGGGKASLTTFMGRISAKARPEPPIDEDSASMSSAAGVALSPMTDLSALSRQAEPAADDDGDISQAGTLDDLSEGEAAELTGLLEPGMESDPRVNFAPQRYVHRCFSLYVSKFTVQLLHTPSFVERAEALGTGLAADSTSLRRLLLSLELSNANLRVRKIKGVGTRAHVVLAAVHCQAGPLPGAERDLSAGPLLFSLDGDAIGFCPDDELGGTADDPGDIEAFLAARRAEGRGFCYGLAGAPPERKRDKERRASLGGAPPRRKSIATPAPPTLPAPPNDRRSKLTRQAAQPLGIVSLGTYSAPRANAAGAVPVQRMQTFDAARSDPPAVRMEALMSEPADQAHALACALGASQYDYVPAFWAAFDVWVVPLEQVVFTSSLGATSALRKNYLRMSRYVAAKSAEEWHKLEQYLMLAFASMADLFDMPSARHKVDLTMAPSTMTLYTERFGTEDEVMLIEMPEVKVLTMPSLQGLGRPLSEISERSSHRNHFEFDAMRESNDDLNGATTSTALDDRQHAEVLIEGPIRVSTSAGKAVAERVLKAGTFGRGNSRADGRLYAVCAEVRELNGKIAQLEAERDELRVVFAGLRARAVADALGAVDPRANREQPAYGDNYAPLPAVEEEAEGTAAAPAPSAEGPLGMMRRSLFGAVSGGSAGSGSDEPLQQLMRKLADIQEWQRQHMLPQASSRSRTRRGRRGDGDQHAQGLQVQSDEEPGGCGCWAWLRGGRRAPPSPILMSPSVREADPELQEMMRSVSARIHRKEQSQPRRSAMSLVSVREAESLNASLSSATSE